MFAKHKLHNKGQSRETGTRSENVRTGYQRARQGSQNEKTNMGQNQK